MHSCNLKDYSSFCLFSITEKHDVKVSVNDIVIKAVAMALKNVPEANGNTFLKYLCTVPMELS